MKTNWDGIEKKYLNEREREYIKRTIIYSEPLNDEKTKNILLWKCDIDRKVLTNKGTSNDERQYARIIEIETLIDIFSGRIPEDIFDFADFVEISSKKSTEVAAKVVMGNLDDDIGEAFSTKEIKEKTEEMGIDTNDPIIEDMIKDFVEEKRKNGENEKIEKMIKNAEFKEINEDTILTVVCLMLTEIKEAEKNGKKLSITMRNIDKNNLIYILIKNLIKTPIKIEDEQKNIYANECPADAIRAYIEKISTEQQKYLEKGEEIPEKFLIPQKIILSPENIEFLLKSKLVNYIGAGEKGEEIKFYWKEEADIPALEVIVKREDNGKYILTYIKEEATKDKKEFLWSIDTVEGKKGCVIVSKKEDALEDIYDMDR